VSRVVQSLPGALCAQSGITILAVVEAVGDQPFRPFARCLSLAVATPIPSTDAIGVEKRRALTGEQLARPMAHPRRLVFR